MAQVGKKPFYKQGDAGKFSDGRSMRDSESGKSSGKGEELVPDSGDERYDRRDKDRSLPQGGKSAPMQPEQGRAERSKSGPNAGTKLFAEMQRAPRAVAAKPTFSHAVFASEAAYDRSVESVVARIKSGAVKARQPDE